MQPVSAHLNVSSSAEGADAPDFRRHALACMAQNAPLGEILDVLCDGIEACEHGIVAQTFLIGEHNGLEPGGRVRLEADHCAEIAKLDGAALTGAPDEARFRLVYQAADRLGQRFGLPLRAIHPLHAPSGKCLGLLALHGNCPFPSAPASQQALGDAVTLAALVTACHLEHVVSRAAQSSLRQSQELLSLALDGSGTGVWDRDARTGEIHYSATWKAILGYAPDEALSSRIEDAYLRLHPDDLQYVRATIQDHFERRTPMYEVEHRIRCKDGSYKWILSRGKVVERDSTGAPVRMLGTSTDVTSTRKLTEQLRESNDLITRLTDEIPGLVYQQHMLPDGRTWFPYASEGVRAIYELEPENVAENLDAVHQRIHPEDQPGYHASLMVSARDLTPWHLQYRVILPRQGIRWRQGDAKPRRTEAGGTMWHGFISDISERKRIESELQVLASIDFLTQLSNRRHFMTRMEEELARVRGMESRRAAVIMCDIDHFKAINDRHGHATGDAVLKYFGSVLRDESRRDDTIGRVGGEEFAVILPEASIEEAVHFAQRVQQRLAERPLLHEGAAIPITISIGISAVHLEDASTHASLSRSDEALYRAKHSGRNRIEVMLA